MSIEERFIKKIGQAVKERDLHTLEQFSQEISNFIKNPHLITPPITKAEKRKLGTLFYNLTRYINKITIKNYDLTLQLNIKRKG